jgi:uncharacterized protein involved in exopolysaccharide biosynthesis
MVEAVSAFAPPAVALQNSVTDTGCRTRLHLRCMMLQTSAIRYEAAEAESFDFGKYLNARYYVELARRRLLHFLIPIILIAPAGAAIVMWLPALYLAEGKVLVESQRIPSELVRPTVTNLAAERMQVMEQRLMTRDNLMSMIEKFRLFADRRSVLSSTELVDLARERIRIKPIELALPRSSADRVTLAFTVGFEYEQPDVAQKVAGELVTLILNEDLKNRTGRASETTKFLAREVSRLQAELDAVERQVLELKKAQAENARGAQEGRRAFLDQTNAQIASLKAERLKKANQLAWNHPEVQALHGRISALERTAASQATGPGPEQDLVTESLQSKQASIQKSLDEASQKLAAARMGEALEKDQQGEKLEVIEQPTLPQRPVKPNRVKLLGLVLALAVFAGAGLVVATEALDSTVRSRSDLARLVESHFIVAIPFVETRRDRFWRKVKLVRTISILLIAIVAGALAAYFLLPPLDLLWTDLLVKVPRYLNR